MINTFVEKIQGSTITDSQILEELESENIQRILSSYIHWYPILDTLISAIYKRSHTLLQNLLKKYSRMNTNLILRICDHSNTDICPVFMWMIRNNFYEYEFTPKNCTTCLAHLISYGNFLPMTFLHQKNMLDNCKRLINKRPNMDDSYTIIQSFAESTNFAIGDKKLGEFIEDVMKILKKSDYDYTNEQLDAFKERVYQHPLLLSTKPLSKSMNFLEARCSIWKEELMAKAWHPSRFQGWCIDLESIREIKMGGFHIEHAKIVKGVKAKWNYD